MTLKHFAWIGGVEVWTVDDGTYVCFIGDLDICNDGSGPSHRDPDFQPRTAYNPYLNADEDKYVVTPPQVRTGVAPVVLGCLARVTRLDQPRKFVSWGVVGDVGPSDKVGECAYCLAKRLNHSITYNSGDSRKMYLYEFFPGTAAPGYKLQAAS